MIEDSKAIEIMTQSEKEPSLLDLVDKWLKRTPELEKEGLDFWSKYRNVVDSMNEDIKRQAEAETDVEKEAQLNDEYVRRKELFYSIFDVNTYNTLRERGE